MEETGHDLIGYFADNSDAPTFDPGPDVVCILCFTPLNHPIREIVTSSFSAFFDHAERSYFYRAHKDCYDQAERTKDEKGDSDISNLEASIMKELGSVQDFARPGLYFN